MKQEFWKSIPFWVVVVTNIVAILVLVVSAENVTLVNVIGQAVIAVITTLGAANNPTNPRGLEQIRLLVHRRKILLYNEVIHLRRYLYVSVF